MMRLVIPERLASCPRCRRLILAWTIVEEEWTEVVWDPGPVQRRQVLALLPRDARGQGFGAGQDAWHICPDRAGPAHARD